MKTIPSLIGVALLVPSVCNAATIDVVSASYGLSCGVPSGNVTHYVSSACNGKSSCRYRIDHSRIGDPARGCGKDFVVKYRCDGRMEQRRVQPEASGKELVLSCREPIRVTSATYGKNCGVNEGNVTHYVSSACNGQSSCRYQIDHNRIGDPARGCTKDFIVRWRCGNTEWNNFVSAEASGKSVSLDCK